MRKYSFFLLSILMIFVSCSDDAQIELSSLEANERNYLSAFGYDDFATAQQQLGNYLQFGIYTDFVARIDVTKKQGLDDSGLVLLNYTPEPGAPPANAGDVTINGLTFQWNSDGGGYSGTTSDPFALADVLKQTCFGQNVEFSIDNSGFQYSNKMYIPKEIEIHNISDQGIVPGSYTHKVTRGGVRVDWNADSNNTNDVLAYIRWDGTTTSTTLGDKIGQNVIERAVVLTDSGSGTLPANLFEGVPQNAILSFNLVRANFDVNQGRDGKSYKTYGISFDKRKFLIMD